MSSIVRTRRRLWAFTLIELLVVIGIIVLLAGILLPVLSRAQHIAKSSKCQSNLKQFGQGMTLYSNQNEGYYCSGSFSPRYSEANCLRVGWVADLVNGGYANVFELNCPSNEAQFSEVLPEMLTDNNGTYNANQPQNALNVEYIAKYVKVGYMTNYVASWYLVRTAMLPNAWESWLTSTDAVPTVDSMRVDYPWNCYGPLTQRQLDSSAALSNTVPLLADANLGNFTTARLLIDCGQFRKSQVGVETATDGPRKFRQGNTYYCRDQKAYETVVTLLTTTNANNEIVWVGQDYVDFGPVHGVGSNKACNMIFADGHAGNVTDKDNDTFIGFTGNQNSPGDLTELDKLFVGNLVSKRRSGTL